jgi:hypothetical protein
VSQLTASDGATGDYFGVSVAISKDASNIVVGASDKDYNTNTTGSGAAYLFHTDFPMTATTRGWTQVGKFVAANASSDDYLGSSVAVENSTVAIGAPWEDNANSGIKDAGSVYILNISGLSTNGEQAIPTPMPSNNTVASTSQPVQTIATESYAPTTLPISPAPSRRTISNDISTPTLTSEPSVTRTNKNVMPTTHPSQTQTGQPSNTIPEADQKPSTQDAILTPRVIVAGIVIVGLVVVILAFLNFKIKTHRAQQEQQQGTRFEEPRAPMETNEVNATAVDETAILMADAVIVHNASSTIEITDYADPETSGTHGLDDSVLPSPLPPSSIISIDSDFSPGSSSPRVLTVESTTKRKTFVTDTADRKDAEREVPRFKDQTNSSFEELSSEENRISERDDHQNAEHQEEDDDDDGDDDHQEKA